MAITSRVSIFFPYPEQSSDDNWLFCHTFSARIIGVVIDNESPMEKPPMRKNSVGNLRGTIL